MVSTFEKLDKESEVQGGIIAEMKAKYRRITKMYRWIIADYMKDERYNLALNYVALMISSASIAGLAWAVSPAVNEILSVERSDWALLIPVGVLALVTLNGVALYVSQVITETIVQNVTLRLHRALYTKFLLMDMATASRLHTGTMIAVMTNEIGRAVTGLTTLLIGISRELISFAFLLAVMIWRDWQLSLFVLISFPPLIFAVAKISKKVRKATSASMQANFQVTRLVTDVLSSLRLVKIFDSIDHEMDRHHGAISTRRKAAIRLTRKKAIMSPVNELSSGLAIAAVVTFTLVRAKWGDGADFGDMASFLTAVFLAFRPLKRITGAIPSFIEGTFAAGVLRSFLDQPSEDRGSEEQGAIETVAGDVDVKNVTFAYEKDETVLKGVSLRLPAGKTVALVGPSGSGKTTLINLIPRLYTVAEGSISIGARDIADIPLSQLRRSIALVSQETILLDGTVRQNIIYGARLNDEERVVDALKTANAWGFVSKLGKGLDTPIGEKGQRLSGGQRQRLALARAIYRDAPILLLDEPTSSLDAQSEKQVRQAIKNISHKRSILIVTHRLPTIRFADYIYVMVDGEIVEEGTHETLLESDGVYASIFRLQALEDRFGRQMTQ